MMHLLFPVQKIIVEDAMHYGSMLREIIFVRNKQNHRECNDLKLAGCKSILVLESCPLQFDCKNEEQLSPVDKNDNLEESISSSEEDDTSSAVSKMKNTFYLFVVSTIAATGVGFF